MRRNIKTLLILMSILTHWYAPYVGSAQRGILSGDTKGNYNPNDFITEKLLKIVLRRVGISVEPGYTWDNVYRKLLKSAL